MNNSIAGVPDRVYMIPTKKLVARLLAKCGYSAREFEAAVKVVRLIEQEGFINDRDRILCLASVVVATFFSGGKRVA